MLNELIKHRRFLHENAEVGFDTPITTNYIRTQLTSMGYCPKKCGRSGIIADIGQNKTGKRFLLRADFDALRIDEQTGLGFASKNGTMHACGHDMHAAMLLGCAKLLKQHENETGGLIRLMFEPAEETLCGALDMIQNGLLDQEFSGAMMLHVMSATGLEKGSVVVPVCDVCAPSADFFKITVYGKGGHGAMPEKCINPILVASTVINAVYSLKTAELSAGTKAAISITGIGGATSANVIPDKAELYGTFRCFDSKVREFFRKRLQDITKSAAAMHRTRAEFEITSGCPEFVCNKKLAQDVIQTATHIFGNGNVIAADKQGGSAGSEDFAYVSQKVPSVMVVIEAGNGFAQHHPKVDYDESVLLNGAKLLSETALLYAK